MRIIHESGHFNSDMRFVTITTRDPPREFMRAYETGVPYERLADVVISDGRARRRRSRRGSRCRAGVCSRSAPTRHQGQAPITPDEFVEVEIAAKMNNLVADALRKRGLDISDRNLVCVDPWSAGYFGEDEDPKNRVARATFYLRKEADDMQYAHPIEGLNALVDLYRKEVIKIEDAGVIPVPQTQRNYDRRFIKKYRDDLKPLEITQPEGPSFKVNGWEVTLATLAIPGGVHAARRARAATTSATTTSTRASERPIIYRAAIVEMTVPYGDTIQTQWRKNAFDIGEYGVGVNTNSLTLGCDCLGEIHYFDFDFVNTAGEIESIPNAVCMHEEDDSILWKHTELRTSKVEVRRSRKLIISSIATVGNYEYGFYWILRQDGSIELEVKAIGLMQTAAVPAGEIEQVRSIGGGGLLRAESSALFLRAARHEPRRAREPGGRGRNTCRPHGPAEPARQRVLYTKSTVFKTELEARRKHKYETARTWVVQNPNSKNRDRHVTSATSCQPMELTVPYWQPGVGGRRAAPAIWTITCGSRRTIPRRTILRASIRIRTPVPTGCPSGRRRTAASRTRRSSSGTTSAITTFRDSRIGR